MIKVNYNDSLCVANEKGIVISIIYRDKYKLLITIMIFR